MRLIYSNIRSLFQNLDLFLCTHYHKNADLFLFSETWSKDNSHLPPIPGYNGFLTPSVLGKSGGVAIYVRNNISVKLINIDSSIEKFSYCEFLAFTLCDFKINVVLLYRHPNRSTKDFFRTIDNLLSTNTFSHSNGHTILIGDFNINILSNSSDSSKLKRIAETHGLTCFINDPTNSNSTTCIDHVFSDLPANDFSKIDLVDDDIGGHKSIILEVSLNKKTKTDYILKRIHSTKNIESFIGAIKSINWNDHVNLSNDIDTNVFNFTSIVFDTYTKNFPLKKFRAVNNHKFWLSSNTAKYVGRKNFLLRSFRRNPNNINKIKLCIANKALKQKIKVEKRTFYKSKIINNSHGKKWETFKFLMGKVNSHIKSSPNNVSPSLNNKEACIMFSKFYGSILSSPHTSTDSLQFTNFCANTIFLQPCTLHEINYVALHLPKKTSCLQTDIPLFLWSILADLIAVPLSLMINQMLLSCTFPTMFKFCDIIPVFKKGDPSQCNNYRPVAMQHNLSKFFEAIILKRLVDFCSHNKIFPDFQYGFRKHHSTKDAIMKLFLHINCSASINVKTLAIFLDLSKAFDCVNHSKLLFILQNLGMRGNCLNLISSFLSNRYFRVKINGFFSDYSPIVKGVPQGCILSPLLYSLYVSDISCISKNIILYADDTTILIPYKSSSDLIPYMEDLSVKIDNYFSSRDLTVNASKTNIISYPHEQIDINFLNSAIVTSNEANFLGFTIDSRLKINSHADAIAKCIKKNFYILYNLRNFLPKKDKKIIFSSYVTPFIIYATPFLLLCNKSSLKYLRQTYNRAIKIIFNLPYKTPTSFTLLYSSCLSLDHFILFHSLIYAFKIFYRFTPSNISNSFTRTPRLLFLLNTHQSGKSLHNEIAIKWNNLPLSVRQSPSLSCFKTSLMAYLTT